MLINNLYFSLRFKKMSRSKLDINFFIKQSIQIAIKMRNKKEFENILLMPNGVKIEMNSVFVSIEIEINAYHAK